jgi:CO/xanthine dehydrogenase Mo-binding subunit
VARVEAAEKTAGGRLYTGDLTRPGMHSLAVARSLHAHARILAVHAEDALQMEGVVAVVTGAELRRRLGDRFRVGPAFQDQPLLAAEKAVFVGEPIAAVVAGTREVARRAADRVWAEYEELEPVLDLERAAAGGPFVHDELRPAGTFADLKRLAGVRDTNVCFDFHLRRGDATGALEGAAHTWAAETWTPPAQHVPIELPACLAWVERGRLELVAATQTPSYVRQSVARVLDLPLARVRVRVPHLGGGFGSKMYDKLEPLTAYLAWCLGRPVQWIPSREEAFLLNSRHGCAVAVRMGADADGNLVGAEADVRYDTGAYADIGPRLCSKSGMVATGPYRTPNVRVRSRCVYTNRPPAGAFRGFGVPQLVWAHESAVDELAREMGRDPLDFRRRNLLREGEVSPQGTVVHSADLVGCLDAVGEAIGWDRPLPGGTARLRRGRGVAVGWKAVLTPTVSGALVQLNADSSATVLTSTVDMGQGSDTVMTQIAAEVLGLDVGAVVVVHPDTDVTPYDTITAGSRSTYHMGNAVRLAAERVRDQLLEVASRELETPAAELVLEAGGVRRRAEEVPRLAVPDLFQAHLGALGATLTGEATYRTEWTPYDGDGQSSRITEYWFAGAAGAEVTVDVETGRVRVDHLAVAADVGRAINPRMCRQQLYGGALMGLAHALFEELVFDEAGRLLNGSLIGYQLPSIRDAPRRATALLVESPHRGGPFGAKGIGETGILAAAPAIGNAVRDATGARITRLPLTPQRVLEALGGGP